MKRNPNNQNPVGGRGNLTPKRTTRSNDGAETTVYVNLDNQSLSPADRKGLNASLSGVAADAADAAAGVGSFESTSKGASAVGLSMGRASTAADLRDAFSSIKATAPRRFDGPKRHAPVHASLSASSPSVEAFARRAAQSGGAFGSEASSQDLRMAFAA